MRIWDLRINKSIMLLQDKLNMNSEIVKAKFIDSSYLISASLNTVSIFDVRKPSIIVNSCFLSKETNSEEINDLDISRMD